MVGNLLQHLFDLTVQILEGTAIVEAEVRLADADAEVLLVGVGVVHLALLVGDEGLVGDVVGLASAQHGALVAHLGVGIDGEEVEIRLSSQRRYLTRSANTLDDAVASRSRSLLVELLDNPRRRMLRPQVVTYQRHRVAIHFQPAPLNLLCDESPNRIMHKTFVLYQIVDNSAFACAQRSSDAYRYH